MSWSTCSPPLLARSGIHQRLLVRCAAQPVPASNQSSKIGNRIRSLPERPRFMSRNRYDSKQLTKLSRFVMGATWLEASYPAPASLSCREALIRSAAARLAVAAECHPVWSHLWAGSASIQRTSTDLCDSSAHLALP